MRFSPIFLTLLLLGLACSSVLGTVVPSGNDDSTPCTTTNKNKNKKKCPTGSGGGSSGSGNQDDKSTSVKNSQKSISISGDEREDSIKIIGDSDSDDGNKISGNVRHNQHSRMRSGYNAQSRSRRGHDQQRHNGNIATRQQHKRHNINEMENVVHQQQRKKHLRNKNTNGKKVDPNLVKQQEEQEYAQRENHLKQKISFLRGRFKKAKESGELSKDELDLARLDVGLAELEMKKFHLAETVRKLKNTNKFGKNKKQLGNARSELDATFNKIMFMKHQRGRLEDKVNKATKKRPTKQNANGLNAQKQAQQSPNFNQHSLKNKAKLKTDANAKLQTDTNAKPNTKLKTDTMANLRTKTKKLVKNQVDNMNVRETVVDNLLGRARDNGLAVAPKSKRKGLLMDEELLAFAATSQHFQNPVTDEYKTKAEREAEAEFMSVNFRKIRKDEDPDAYVEAFNKEVMGDSIKVARAYAKSVTNRINDIARSVTDELGGRVITAPPKGANSIAGKIGDRDTKNKYKKNVANLKDVARNTVLVLTPEDAVKAAADIKKKAKEDFDQLDLETQEKLVKLSGMPGGAFEKVKKKEDYSGYTDTTLQIPIGLNPEGTEVMYAEVQINTPNMMWAKDKENLERALGPQKFKELDAKMKAAIGGNTEAGHGHHLYEDSRKIGGEKKKLKQKLAKLDDPNSLLTDEQKATEREQYQTELAELDAKAKRLEEESQAYYQAARDVDLTGFNLGA